MFGLFYVAYPAALHNFEPAGDSAFAVAFANIIGETHHFPNYLYVDSLIGQTTIGYGPYTFETLVHYAVYSMAAIGGITYYQSAVLLGFLWFISITLMVYLIARNVSQRVGLLAVFSIIFITHSILRYFVETGIHFQNMFGDVMMLLVVFLWIEVIKSMSYSIAIPKRLATLFLFMTVLTLITHELSFLMALLFVVPSAVLVLAVDKKLVRMIKEKFRIVLIAIAFWGAVCYSLVSYYPRALIEFSAAIGPSIGGPLTLNQVVSVYPAWAFWVGMIGVTCLAASVLTLSLNNYDSWIRILPFVWTVGIIGTMEGYFGFGVQADRVLYYLSYPAAIGVAVLLDVLTLLLYSHKLELVLQGSDHVIKFPDTIIIDGRKSRLRQPRAGLAVFSVVVIALIVVSSVIPNTQFLMQNFWSNPSNLDSTYSREINTVIRTLMLQNPPINTTFYTDYNLRSTQWIFTYLMSRGFHVYQQPIDVHFIAWLFDMNNLPNGSYVVLWKEDMAPTLMSMITVGEMKIILETENIVLLERTSYYPVQSMSTMIVPCSSLNSWSIIDGSANLSRVADKSVWGCPSLSVYNGRVGGDSAFQIQSTVILTDLTNATVVIPLFVDTNTTFSLWLEDQSKSWNRYDFSPTPHNWNYIIINPSLPVSSGLNSPDLTQTQYLIFGVNYAHPSINLTFWIGPIGVYYNVD